MADNMGNAQRIDWVEPEVREIAIAETSLLPNHGGDGETIWSDCTLS